VRSKGVRPKSNDRLTISSRRNIDLDLHVPISGDRCPSRERCRDELSTLTQRITRDGPGSSAVYRNRVIRLSYLPSRPKGEHVSCGGIVDTGRGAAVGAGLRYGRL
jgi:hypothetical protein